MSLIYLPQPPCILNQIKKKLKGCQSCKLNPICQAANNLKPYPIKGTARLKKEIHLSIVSVSNHCPTTKNLLLAQTMKDLGHVFLN